VKILLVQEADWVAKGPHQQHHLFERMQVRGHIIRIIDYESYWKKNKHKSIIARRKEYYAEGKVEKNSHLHVIRPTMLRIPVLCYLSIILFHYLELKRQISEFKPDVIVGMGILNSFMAVILSAKYRIPFAYYVIDSLHTLIQETSFQMIGKFLESQIVKRADVILVINRGLGDYVHSLGASRDRIHVVSTGVDLDRMNPTLDGRRIRARYNIAENDIVLFFMGNMFPFSGLKELAEELLNRPEAIHVKMLLLGRGDLFDTLHSMSLDSRALNRIILVNWVDYQEVPFYIAAADFTLLPAHLNEVMRSIVPIKTYEYLACGKPLFATKLPGIMKELGRGNGVIYVESAKDIVSKVLELENTPEKIKQIGQNAVDFVTPLAWPKLTGQFLDLLVETVVKGESG